LGSDVEDELVVVVEEGSRSRLFRDVVAVVAALEVDAEREDSVIGFCMVVEVACRDAEFERV
jgi:hypothetical protein